MKKIYCMIFGHDWDLYSGFESWNRPFKNATCKKCGKKNKD